MLIISVRISPQSDEQALIPCDVINFHHEEQEGHEEKLLSMCCTHLFVTQIGVLRCENDELFITSPVTQRSL